MNRQIPWLLLVFGFFTITVAYLVLVPREVADAAPARQTRNAWDPPTDAGEALNAPDQFAWELFVAMNWPADLENKRADPTQPFGKPNVPVTWQTWKLQEEVYRHDGIDPGPWEDKPAYVHGAMDEAICFPLQQTITSEIPELPCELALSLAFQEVRMNRATYDYIRAHELYNIEGLLKAY